VAGRGRAGRSHAPRGDSRARRQRRNLNRFMIQPDFKSFSRLAKQGNLVPVYETFTADLLTPVGAHLRLARNAKYSFLLESVEGGETIARYTFTGANPEEVFRSRGCVCALEAAGKRTEFDENPIEQLRRLAARYRPVRVPGLPPLIAGAIGYFAYDMVRLVEDIPANGRDELALDDCVMMFYLGLVAFDHVQHRVWVIRNVFTKGEGSLRAKYNRALREIQRTRRALEHQNGPSAGARYASPRISRSRGTSPRCAKRRPTFAPEIFFKWCRASDFPREPRLTRLRSIARCAW
jgi:anthranilate synthase component 1